MSAVWPPAGEPVEVLTRRQQDVLLLVATGHTTSQVARTLGLSVETVKSHLRRMFARLDVHDRAHAVHVAHLRGLL